LRGPAVGDPGYPVTRYVSGRIRHLAEAGAVRLDREEAGARVEEQQRAVGGPDEAPVGRREYAGLSQPGTVGLRDVDLAGMVERIAGRGVRPRRRVCGSDRGYVMVDL